MGTRVITPPANLAISVEVARVVCGEVETGESGYDAAISELLQVETQAVVKHAMHVTGRSIMRQTLELTMDAFPTAGDIRLYYPDILNIISVKYVDPETLEEVVVDSNDYVVTNKREYEAWLLPAAGKSWPVSANVADGVSIIYEAGFKDADSIPFDVKLWLRTALKFVHEGGCDGEMPRDFNAAYLDSIRVYG